MRKTGQIILLFMLFIICALTGFIYMVDMKKLSVVVLLAVAVTAVSVGACCTILQRERELFKKYAPLLIVAAAVVTAFLVRSFYIIYTPTWERQHDVIGFGAGFGQAGLIEYFYEKMHLIDTDPRKLWGFFQPPLHHIIAAMWLKLQVFFGKPFAFSYDHSCENIQCLTLFYSLVTTVFGIKLVSYVVNAGNAARRGVIITQECVIPAIFIALHPCFILMSGSINNDMLCVMLQIICAYYFVRYLNEDKTWQLLISALFLGLSMMAKLSGILIAPAIGVLLLYRFVKAIINSKTDKNNTEVMHNLQNNRVKNFLCGNNEASPAKLIVSYLLFGLISIPLGIWSPVRNLVKFGVPLNYTPEVGEPLAQSLVQRIIDIRTSTPFTCMLVNGNEYDEFNIPLAMLKTSLIGEYDFGGVHRFAGIIGWILLISGAVLSILILFMTVDVMISEIKLNADLILMTRSGSKKAETAAFLGIYGLFSYAFLINLCVSIPNFSSQDYRYIAHCIVIQAAFMGMYFAKNKNKRSVILLSVILTSLFAIAAVLLYILVGRA